MSESLRSFVLRGEVLKLYRSFLRTVRQAPPHAQSELLEQVRQGFRSHQAAKDLYTTKYLLSDGRSQLKMLRETLLMNQ